MTRTDDYNEKRALIEGNIRISQFAYGEGRSKQPPYYFQVGYTKGPQMHGVYRRIDDLADDSLPNFHTSFELLVPVIAKIAKDYKRHDTFSKEGVIADRLKHEMVDNIYDIRLIWTTVLDYVNLKQQLIT
jgi:hypothetical protein